MPCKESVLEVYHCLLNFWWVRTLSIERVIYLGQGYTADNDGVKVLRPQWSASEVKGQGWLPLNETGVYNKFVFCLL